MSRRPPRSTRSDTLFPPTTLFRSLPVTNLAHARRVAGCHGERGNGKDFSMGFSLGTGFRAGPGARSACALGTHRGRSRRSEEHTSELQSLMRISSAVFCLNKNKTKLTNTTKYE